MKISWGSERSDSLANTKIEVLLTPVCSDLLYEIKEAVYAAIKDDEELRKRARDPMEIVVEAMFVEEIEVIE